jgi:hypothetical protein
LDLFPQPASERRTVGPLVRFGVGLFATAVLAAVAFWLGAWAFAFRTQHQHEQRLRHMLEVHPTTAQVVEGLRNDGSPLIAAPGDFAGLEREAARYGRDKQPEILDKGRRWPLARFFLAGDMVYVIYFDQAGVMRDYTRVSR